MEQVAEGETKGIVAEVRDIMSEMGREAEWSRMEGLEEATEARKAEIRRVGKRSRRQGMGKVENNAKGHLQAHQENTWGRTVPPMGLQKRGGPQDAIQDRQCEPASKQVLGE